MAQIFKSQQVIPAQYVPVFLENPDVQESIHSESSESIILCPKMVWTPGLIAKCRRGGKKMRQSDPSHAAALLPTNWKVNEW